MQEMQVRSLVWEDLLEKEMAIHSSILAWESPQTEETGRLQSMGWQESQHNLATNPPLLWWQRVINLFFAVYRWTVWIQTSLHSFTNWFWELGNSFNLVSQLPHVKNMCVCVCVLVAQSCLTLRPMDCSLPNSSVHGILQARILEWVAIPFSWRTSRPRYLTQVSCISGRFFTIWANREVSLQKRDNNNNQFFKFIK